MKCHILTSVNSWAASSGQIKAMTRTGRNSVAVSRKRSSVLRRSGGRLIKRWIEPDEKEKLLKSWPGNRRNWPHFRDLRCWRDVPRCGSTGGMSPARWRTYSLGDSRAARRAWRMAAAYRQAGMPSGIAFYFRRDVKRAGCSTASKGTGKSQPALRRLRQPLSKGCARRKEAER